MRVFHKIGIRQYVYDTIHDRKVGKIIDEWSVDYEDIEEILVDHFEMMGIYEVLPMQQDHVLRDTILYQLKYNPKIREKVEYMRKLLEEQSARIKRKGGA